MPVRVTFEATEHDMAVPVFEPRGRRLSASLGGAAAIVGIGQTEFSKAAGRSETQLASEAIVAALADAGLTTDDVDGFVSYTIDPVEETELVRALGTPEIRWSSRVPYGGGGSQGVLLHAAAASRRRRRGVVVAYRAIKARSGARFGRAAGEPPSVVVALGHDRESMVLALRRAHARIVDGVERDPVHAQLRHHERRLRAGRRAAARIRRRIPTPTSTERTSRSTTIRRRVGSPNPRSDSSTAARRPTARSRWSSPPPSGSRHASTRRHRRRQRPRDCSRRRSGATTTDRTSR